MGRKRVRPRKDPLRKDALVELAEFEKSVEIGHGDGDYRSLTSNMGHLVQVFLDVPVVKAGFVSADHAALKRLQGMIGGEVVGDQLYFEGRDVKRFADACASLLDPDCEHCAPTLRFFDILYAMAQMDDPLFSRETSVTWDGLVERVKPYPHAHGPIGDDASMFFLWHKEGATLGNK